ncbi:MAG: DUF2795 domain-containing protein [Coriobacteriia bacterium]|nr:DUF2795 domain-containing protein [Coriobacteriia bacterium]
MPNRPVTRVEIADAVEEAFIPHGATRSELIEHAANADARPQVLSVLERLPDRRYGRLRELWDHLFDVPVEVVPTA